jgi:hypothetical protein
MDTTHLGRRIPTCEWGGVVTQTFRQGLCGQGLTVLLGLWQSSRLFAHTDGKWLQVQKQNVSQNKQSPVVNIDHMTCLGIVGEARKGPRGPGQLLGTSLRECRLLLHFYTSKDCGSERYRLDVVGMGAFWFLS